MRIFVYGTLLTGFGNWERFLKDKAYYRGLGETLPVYTMLNLGSFPGVIEGGSTAIKGEIFEVDAQTLARLDRLEGHPNFYRRTPITLADGRPVEIYISNRSDTQHYTVVTSGSWRDK